MTCPRSSSKETALGFESKQSDSRVCTLNHHGFLFPEHTLGDSWEVLQGEGIQLNQEREQMSEEAP